MNGDRTGIRGVDPGEEERFRNDDARSNAVVIGFEPLYGEWLSALIRPSQSMLVIDNPVPAEKVAAALALHRPSVALLCDESLDLVDFAQLAQAHPETGMVVVAKLLTPARAHALDKCGAAAMLERDMDPRLLLLVAIMIARGARGGIHMNSSEALTETMAPKLAGLSTRESLVLELLREHRSLGAIAGALGVSRATINSQAQSIYRKLGVSSRGELREAIAAMDPQTEPGRIQREMTTPRTRVAFASRNRERGVPGWVQRPLTVVR